MIKILEDDNLPPIVAISNSLAVIGFTIQKTTITGDRLAIVHKIEGVEGIEDLDAVADTIDCSMEMCLAFSSLCQFMRYVAPHKGVALCELHSMDIMPACCLRGTFDDSVTDQQYVVNEVEN